MLVFFEKVVEDENINQRRRKMKGMIQLQCKLGTRARTLSLAFLEFTKCLFYYTQLNLQKVSVSAL